MFISLFKFRKIIYHLQNSKILIGKCFTWLHLSVLVLIYKFSWSLPYFLTDAPHYKGSVYFYNARNTHILREKEQNPSKNHKPVAYMQSAANLCCHTSTAIFSSLPHIQKEISESFHLQRMKKTQTKITAAYVSVYMGVISKASFTSSVFFLHW